MQRRTTPSDGAITDTGESIVLKVLETPKKEPQKEKAPSPPDVKADPIFLDSGRSSPNLLSSYFDIDDGKKETEPLIPKCNHGDSRHHNHDEHECHGHHHNHSHNLSGVCICGRSVGTLVNPAATNVSSNESGFEHAIEEIKGGDAHFTQTSSALGVKAALDIKLARQLPTMIRQRDEAKAEAEKISIPTMTTYHREQHRDLDSKVDSAKYRLATSGGRGGGQMGFRNSMVGTRPYSPSANRSIGFANADLEF